MQISKINIVPTKAFHLTGTSCYFTVFWTVIVFLKYSNLEWQGLVLFFWVPLHGWEDKQTLKEVYASVTYVLHQQLCPAKFSILILIYFLFQKLRISHSHAAFGRYSHVSVHEFYEKEREVRVMEQCGLVAIFHHAESFVMFALHHGSMESEWRTFWEMTRGPSVDLFSKSYWSFVIAICLLTESMLIFFFFNS